MDALRNLIEKAWEDHNLLTDIKTQEAIHEVINLLETGTLRAARKDESGQWSCNEWVRKALLLYFPLCKMETHKADIFEKHDKGPLKTGFEQLGIRVVPPATARYGSFINKGCLLMPSHVSIGVYMDSNTIVDTWATVGSCAQIGKNVHISSGVTIGGMLEPAQPMPVIIEDNCFIGSRSVVEEGIHLEEGVILAAGTILNRSIKIIDVSMKKLVSHENIVPANSIVIPGSFNKHFAVGDFQIPCALIIGKRKKTDDFQDSLDDALKNFNIAL